MTKVGEDKVVRTICRIHGFHCGILAHVRKGVLVKVEPADYPDSRLRHLCARCLCSPKLVYHPDRLKYPLKRVGERGEGKWQRTSWGEALDIIATKFKEIGDKHGYESIAWATYMFVYLRLVSALQSTLVNLVGFGDAAGPCGDRISYGTGNAHHYTIGFESPAMCVIWGANSAETGPHWWPRLRHAKERGAKLVVIDPRFTTTASKADEYISIRPGTDIALALGMMNVILRKGLVDEPFVTDNTVGPFLVRCDNGLFLRESDIAPGGSDKYIIWDRQANKLGTHDERDTKPALRGVYRVAGVECKPSFQLLTDLVEQYPLEKASDITEVPAGTIEKLAIEYATLRPVASYRGMGLQRTFHGDLAFRAITALAAVTGNIKLEGYRRFVLNPRALMFGGRFPGLISLLQMYETVLTGQPYPIKALWIARHNFMNQNPDNNKVLKEIVPRMEFIVVADMFMNDSAQYADIVLPTCSFFEYLDVVQPIDQLLPYMQLQPKVIEPYYESKPDREIVNELGARMGLGKDFSLSAEQYIGLLLSSGHVSVEGITLEKLEKGPIEVPPYHVPVFRTPSARIEFYSERMKEFGEELPVYKEPLESARKPLARKYPLSYLSAHTKYGCHGSLDNVAWLRQLDAEPLLEMNPLDAEERGITDGDIVVAFNDRGRVKLKAKIHQGIKPGVVNINQGWWRHHYTEGTHQALTHAVINPAQVAVFDPNSALFDVLVEVRKAAEG